MSDLLIMGDVQGCAAELRDLLKVVGLDRERHRLALRSDGAAFHGEWIGRKISATSASRHRPSCPWLELLVWPIPVQK